MFCLSSTGQGIAYLSSIIGILHIQCQGEQKENAKPKLEAINIAEPLIPRQEHALIASEVNRHALVSGTMNGRAVDGVLFDIGSERTLFDSTLIKDEDQTGEVIHSVQCTNLALP